MATIENETREMCRLYVEKGLTLRGIAARFNISRQAVHLRLTKAGVVCRSSNAARKAGKKRLEELHLDQGLPVSTIAKILGSTARAVAAELQRHGIERRPVRGINRKYPELDRLLIGDSVVIPSPCSSTDKPYGHVYSAARIRGIRLSVKSVERIS